MKAWKRGPSCHGDGDAGSSRQWFWLAGPDASDKGLNVQEFICRYRKAPCVVIIIA